MKRMAIMFVILLALPAWSETRADYLERLARSAEVFQELVSAPDRGVPYQVLDGAKCVAVVPSMFRAGFIFGGRHGKGVATCRLPNGEWSAPAFFTITGGSWGLQIGVQGVDLVMMIMNHQGMKGLLSGQFELGADASVAAGPWGRNAAGKLGWDAAVLTYSRARGVYGGLTLGGARIYTDKDANEDVYGRPHLSHKDILTGKVTPPAGSGVFLSAVARAKRTAEGE